MAEDHDDAGGRNIAERLREELRRYAMISAYLFVCFSVILLYRSAVLLEQGQHFLPFGTAAVKALVLGKFLMIGEALWVGGRLPAKTLIGRIALRSLMLLVVLLLMTLVEEVVVGWVHHQPAAASLGEFFGPLLPERLAVLLVMLLVLVPFVALIEINRVLGAGTLGRFLRGPVE
jgi:hypothetical protein